MNNLISDQGGVNKPPKCKLKSKKYPNCNYYKNTLPFSSREEIHKILPSPKIEWSDYCQTFADSFYKTLNDFEYVKKVIKKAERQKELNGGSDNVGD